MDLKAIRDDIEKKKMASNDYIAFLKKWKDLMDAVITEFGPLSDRSYLKEGTIEMTERKTSYLRKLYGGGRDLSGSSYKIGSTAGKAGRPNNTETYTLDGKDYTLGTGPARSDVGPELSKNSPTSIPEKGLEEIEMKNASEHEADYLIYTAADKDPAVDMFYSSNEGGAQQDARFLFDYGALPKNADLINEGYAGENYSFLDNPSADMSRLDDLSLRFDTHMINPSIAKTGIGNSSLPEISGSDLFRNEHEPAGQLGDPSMTQVLNPELGLEAGFGFDQDYSIAVDKFQTKGFASQIHDWASSAAIVQRDTEDGALMQQDTPESHMNDDATQD